LPRTELSNAIDKLSTDLGLPLREAIITRIDIGMNVEVDNPPRSYFSYFGILKKFERNIYFEPPTAHPYYLQIPRLFPVVGLSSTPTLLPVGTLVSVHYYRGGNMVSHF